MYSTNEYHRHHALLFPFRQSILRYIRHGWSDHPGKLKDAVCSPGGTTIEGVYALEKGGMRAAVMDAVGATVEKTLRLSKS